MYDDLLIMFHIPTPLIKPHIIYKELREKTQLRKQQTQNDQYLKLMAKQKKRKKKWINTSEDEIQVALDKIFGPRTRVKQKASRFKSQNLRGSKSMRDMAYAKTLKDWSSREVCMSSKEKITNRLAKTNVYFQTKGGL